MLHIEASVISLNDKNGQKRLQHFEENVKSKLGIKMNVFKATKHDRGGTYGCWDSHKKVLQQALRKGSDYILVFEDDAIISPQFSLDLFFKVLADTKFLPKDWDLIGLGGISSCWSSAPQQVSQYFYQTPFFELHSYIASKKFMNSVSIMDYNGQVDYAFARRAFSTSYLCATELFLQDDQLGSHNSFQRAIIPFRIPFKAVTREAMKLQVKIRNIFLALLLACTIAKASPYIIYILFIFIALFDVVLDPSFPFRKSALMICPQHLKV